MSTDLSTRIMGGYSNSSSISSSSPEAGDYKILHTAGGVQLHMINEVYIRLTKEIHLYHPDVAAAIQAVAANDPRTDWITKLSAVAAACEILMDGHFTAAELEKVADACLAILIGRRTGISVPVPNFDLENQK